MKKILLILLALFAYTNSSAQTFNYNFSTGTDGWEAMFCDYPYVFQDQMELNYSWDKLPAPLDENEGAICISANNISSDLFMGMKKKIEGLKPNTSYFVKANITFASDVALGLFGAGGDPAQGVNMKIGVTSFEPKVEVVNYRLQINFDKGNQKNSGKDMKYIGHIGIPEGMDEYMLKTNTNEDQEFRFTTDENGEAWLLVATESGFAGRTKLYYDDITFEFQEDPTLAVEEEEKSSLVFPNPSNGTINITEDLKNIKVMDLNGNLVTSISDPAEVLNLNLSNGSYYLILEAVDNKIHKEMIIISN